MQTPWDRILGTRSHIRVLRTLERARGPLSVRELARRADEHLRSAQIAVQRLSETGILERVGSGSQQLVQWNERHPLSRALEQLFAAERQRREHILEQLTRIAQRAAQTASFVWLQELDSTLRIGVLGHSADIDAQVDALREALVPLMRDEQLLIEVQGWTAADLAAVAATAGVGASGPVVALWGVLPPQWSAAAEGKPRGRRSHADIDAELRERAVQLAALVRSRPELLRLAKEEIQTRLQQSDASTAKSLREWGQILEALTPSTFARWLSSDGEQAVRLRQSLPLTLLRALEADRKLKS